MYLIHWILRVEAFGGRLRDPMPEVGEHVAQMGLEISGQDDGSSVIDS